LSGIGKGILQDLEDDLNVTEGNKIGDSTMEVFAKKADLERKAVHFAEETESHYSESRQFTDRPIQSRPSSKSSTSEENKLQGINSLLKNNDFRLRDDDEPDFALFMQKLHEKTRGGKSEVQPK
jgi:O-succinylbenzoate synthase